MEKLPERTRAACEVLSVGYKVKHPIIQRMESIAAEIDRNNAPPPTKIKCPACSELNEFSRDLFDRSIFHIPCDKCKKTYQASEFWIRKFAE